MNNLQTLEFELLRNIDKEMPLHTPITAKVPHVYGSLPKNLMDLSAYVDERFLNKKQHLIEEIYHRDNENKISNWLYLYQKDYYEKYGLLAKDNFFKTRIEMYRYIAPSALYIRGGGVRVNSFMSFGKIFGTALTSGDTSSNVNVGTGSVYANKTDSTGTVNTYYDQIALDCTLAVSGNYHLGAYDDNSGVPNNLEADTGSIAVTADFAYKSVTEFKITVVQQWICYQQDSTIPFFNNKIVTGASGKAKSVSHTYGALPNPYGTSSQNTRQYHQKMGHS